MSGFFVRLVVDNSMTRNTKYIPFILLFLLALMSPVAARAASDVFTSTTDSGVTTYEFAENGWLVLNTLYELLMFCFGMIVFLISFFIGKSLVKK